MSVIALENLSVSHRQGYELRTVVHEVNLRIEPGECFGLVGPSGCGKSSLLWVLAGLNGSWQGGFELLGRRLQPGQAFTGELRREVQMVFQDPYASLHPKHRLLRTLSEPLKLLKESDIERKVSAGFRGGVGSAPVGSLPASAVGRPAAARGDCARIVAAAEAAVAG